MIEKGAMLTSGGTSRLDPEDDEEEEEGGYEEEGDAVEEEEERGSEMDGISARISSSTSGSRDQKDGSTAVRVYQGLLPQHFNLPQKVIYPESQNTLVPFFDIH